MNQPLNLMSLSHAAEYLSTSRETLYKWIKRGLLPKPMKIGSTCVFTVEQLQPMVGWKEKKKKKRLKGRENAERAGLP